MYKRCSAEFTIHTEFHTTDCILAWVVKKMGGDRMSSFKAGWGANGGGVEEMEGGPNTMFS